MASTGSGSGMIVVNELAKKEMRHSASDPLGKNSLQKALSCSDMKNVGYPVTEHPSGGYNAEDQGDDQTDEEWDNGDHKDDC